jgi:glycosyltransferase involved in cell wall biosynthesis
VNIFHINADQVSEVRKSHAHYFRGRYNIGYWMWELSACPKQWDSAFEPFNEIWTASAFVRDAIATRAPVPVSVIPLSLNPEVKIDYSMTRSQLGLNDHTYLFTFFFDFYSYMERKNPMGLVTAFRKAFGNGDDAHLLLKCAHSEFDRESFGRLQRAIEGANITLYREVLPREQVNRILSLCDCYVSLHRSEGFGLTLMEAMQMGKPVIATNYSGNVDFMSQDNSFLVDYKMIELQKQFGPYEKGRLWSEPDLDHAAGLMRFVFENKEKARAVGERGRADVQAMLHPRAVGELAKRRLLAALGRGEELRTAAEQSI